MRPALGLAPDVICQPALPPHKTAAVFSLFGSTLDFFRPAFAEASLAPAREGFRRGYGEEADATVRGLAVRASRMFVPAVVLLRVSRGISQNSERLLLFCVLTN